MAEEEAAAVATDDGGDQPPPQSHDRVEDEAAGPFCCPVSTDLDAWLALPPADRPQLIDVRAPEAFAAMRLEGSANLPAAELVDLLFELPEPSTSLALVAGSVGEGEGARALLWEKGWRRLPFVFDGEEGKGEQGGLWRGAKEAGMLATGPVPPLARAIAYTPQPFLASVTPLIEAGLAQSFPLQPQGRWSCCDVGCGSGRDAIWLAKRGLWSVRAVDRLGKCLAKVQQLSARHGVERNVACEEAVIKTGVVVSSSPYPPSEEQEHMSFEQREYDLVVVVRFLERDFYGALRRMVRPKGGYILFVSFLDRSKEGIVYESPKDPRRLLQPGELAREFGVREQGFEVVKDEVWPLPDGRHVSAFLGRRVEGV